MPRKQSFPIRASLVNMNKSTGNCANIFWNIFCASYSIATLTGGPFFATVFFGGSFFGGSAAVADAGVAALVCAGEGAAALACAPPPLPPPPAPDVNSALS